MATTNLTQPVAACRQATQHRPAVYRGFVVFILVAAYIVVLVSHKKKEVLNTFHQDSRRSKPVYEATLRKRHKHPTSGSARGERHPCRRPHRPPRRRKTKIRGRSSSERMRSSGDRCSGTTCSRPQKRALAGTETHRHPSRGTTARPARSAGVDINGKKGKARATVTFGGTLSLTTAAPGERSVTNTPVTHESAIPHATARTPARFTDRHRCACASCLSVPPETGHPYSRVAGSVVDL